MLRGTPVTGFQLPASHTGLLPSMVSAFQPLILLAFHLLCACTSPRYKDRRLSYSLSLRPLYRFGLFRFRSPLLAESLFVFFSCGYLDVSVPHVSPRYAMDSHNGTRVLSPGGFPHSDICGSTAICASPQLFAAYHVLHRLLVPRHSPYALSSLTS